MNSQNLHGVQRTIMLNEGKKLFINALLSPLHLDLFQNQYLNFHNQVFTINLLLEVLLLVQEVSQLAH